MRLVRPRNVVVLDRGGTRLRDSFRTIASPLARAGGRKKSAASHEYAPGDFALVAYSPHCRIAPVSALVAILA